MIREAVKSKVLELCHGYNKKEVRFFLDYNLVGGKELRYKGYLHVIRSLGGEEDEKSCVAGYSVELLQAALLITDDVMDNSLVRRGRPCYYLKRGMKTLRDALFLLGVIRKLVGEEMKRLYSASIFRTCLGQTHDTIRKTRPEYNMETYAMIAESKTGAYSFYLPAALGYASANRREPQYLWGFSKLGALIFQMQDDYLNFVPEKSGKTMNDLEEMKCTWFTSRLSPMTHPAVERYFSSGIVSDELLAIVKGLFGEYSLVLRQLASKLLGMVEEEDKKALGIFVSLLDARMEL